jgi:hypothetical protein
MTQTTGAQPDAPADRLRDDLRQSAARTLDAIRGAVAPAAETTEDLIRRGREQAALLRQPRT